MNTLLTLLLTLLLAATPRPAAESVIPIPSETAVGLASVSRPSTGAPLEPSTGEARLTSWGGQAPVATFYSWQEYGCGSYKSWTIPCATRHPLACGGWYRRGTVGVASRTLPCGTRVEFRYRGRTVVAPVVDRGPFTAGVDWDLTTEACLRLRHCFTGPIEWRIVR